VPRRDVGIRRHVVGIGGADYGRKSTAGLLKIPCVAGTFSFRFSLGCGQQQEQRGICGL
jgi:hypothetical protein